MPYFSDEWLHELHTKIDLADLVGSYVTLQNKSGRWWACCPFHHEKTPSFTVNPEKGFFHCFGCGKSGNAIHFVMEMEKMTFPEACTYLAEKVNLPVPERTDNAQYEKRKAERQKIQQMNREAAVHFHQCLYTPEGKVALDYLHGRSLTDGVIKAFGLGFAKDGWDNLIPVLEAKGFTKQDMLNGGLVKQNEGRYYDLFRNRVMMPIINTFSEVIGFGGRVMDDSMPKYLNSPETAAFSKSKNLYNLNMVRKQKNLQSLVLVEGYMDVIALYSNGVQNCVATLGTALTSEQARLLRRYVDMAYISYDGDEAGIKAALRAVDVLEKEQIECRVVSIPGGGDPDDYMKEYGRESYGKLLAAASPAIEFKFDVAARKYDLQDGLQNEKYVQECIAILKEVPSAVVREKYIRNLAERTGFSEHSIMQDIGMEVKDAPVEFKKERPKGKADKITAPAKAENYVIAYLAANPQRAEVVEKHLQAADFRNTTNEKIYSYILNAVKRGIMPQGDEILSVLIDEKELNHASRLLMGSTKVFGEGKQADSVLTDCVKLIKIRNKKEELDGLTQAERNEPNEEAKRKIREKLGRVTKELHDMREKFSGTDIE